MASPNNDILVSRAAPHTIKKFELIEEYVKSWAQKLLQNSLCDRIVFIDCMCNSGIYQDHEGNCVYGTPIRVSKVLRDVAGQYPSKHIFVYLNDLSQEKLDLLRTKLPSESRNFKYSITCKDANDRLREIGPKLPGEKQLHFFLFYDPYDASIDWNALAPFFRSWGEVLINHMVNDSIRAITQAKTVEAKQKYEETYLSDFEALRPYGTDRQAYEARISQIIASLTKGSRNYYVASFPFFNSKNSFLYDLIHCTGNKAGFELYKKTAWKVFGGKSSGKTTHGAENQYTLDFDGTGKIKTQTDERCYCIQDISDYLQTQFAGKLNVPLEEVWATLEQHPVFPSEGYRRDIKGDLKVRYGITESNGTVSFPQNR